MRKKARLFERDFNAYLAAAQPIETLPPIVFPIGHLFVQLAGGILRELSPEETREASKAMLEASYRVVEE
jgi:hypothetical protein